MKLAKALKQMKEGQQVKFVGVPIEFVKLGNGKIKDSNKCIWTQQQLVGFLGDTEFEII